jgi:hypothetical protein
MVVDLVTPSLELDPEPDRTTLEAVGVLLLQAWLSQQSVPHSSLAEGQFPAHLLAQHLVDFAVAADIEVAVKEAPKSLSVPEVLGDLALAAAGIAVAVA